MSLLDASTTSDLNWEVDPDETFWELDFGLKNLKQNEAQFHALRVAVEHFYTAVWNERSEGVCFYRGSLDFSENFPWNDALHEQCGDMNPKLFCRNVIMDLLGMLARSIPIRPQIILDDTAIADPYERAQLLDIEYFEEFDVVFEKPRLGVCITHPERYDPWLAKILTKIDRPHRIVYASNLNADWHGLDELIVNPEDICHDTLRKFMGFVAAGGKILLPEGKSLSHPFFQSSDEVCGVARF